MQDDGYTINPEVLHPDAVNPCEWPFVHRRDLDALCGSHDLRTAARRFEGAVKYQDDPARAPRVLRHLAGLRGRVRDVYRKTFGRQCPLWLATQFLWSLVRRLPERVRSSVRRYANKPRSPFYRPFVPHGTLCAVGRT